MNRPGFGPTRLTWIMTRRLISVPLLTVVVVAAVGTQTSDRSRAAAADFSPATCFGGGRAQQNGPLVVAQLKRPASKFHHWREPIYLAAPDGSHRRVVATRKDTHVEGV